LLSTEQLSVRYAHDKEKLLLLDNETIELTTQDLVVADGQTPVSLAGIMGGATTAINKQTKSVLLEAAHFDPVVIRRSTARHKKRTESSIRFEKNIDPTQNVIAIKRFLFLLDRAHISYTADDAIALWGDSPQEIIIRVGHSFIERRLGIVIEEPRVISILTKRAFGVEQSVEDGNIVYVITVPSFRATKDISIAEDIVEEVGRSIGYDTFIRVMPALPLQSNDLRVTSTKRAIKQFLSFGLQMRELYGYSFFDESMLRQLAWQPTECVDIKNPISENYTRMVTTLQPYLLKAVQDNSIAHEQLRFYEWARVWHMHGENIIEQRSLSGIFFDAAHKIDFYEGKALLSRLFDQLGIYVAWDKLDDCFPWYVQHQAARIMHENKCIGMAGMAQQAIVDQLTPAGGSLFIFELNADYLLDYQKPLVRFNPLSKYPSIRRDISILISDAAIAADLQDAIKQIDSRIVSVLLIDFFNKPEWKDKKAMTFHVEIEDKEKTLTSAEVDEIWQRLITCLQQEGASVR
jgi:phenylalanyl-tRNA synthetase beta chain